MSSNAMANYFIRLHDRRDEAIPLEVREVKFLDGTVPERNRCHANVDRWVAETKGASAVRGWLVMSYGFERHSVVREDGRLIDITLPDSYRFLSHEGSDDLFDQLGAQGCNQVIWPVTGNEA